MKLSITNLFARFFRGNRNSPLPTPPTAEDYYLRHLRGRQRDRQTGPALPIRPTLW